MGDAGLKAREPEIHLPAGAHISTLQAGRGTTIEAPANHPPGPEAKVVSEGGASVHFFKLISPQDVHTGSASPQYLFGGKASAEYSQ